MNLPAFSESTLARESSSKSSTFSERSRLDFLDFLPSEKARKVTRN